MNSGKLTWGLLSTARINRMLIPVLLEEPRCELLAVASRDVERAKAYAVQWNIPRAYGSYDALLQDQDIDVVYISLPNSLHCRWTIASAHAGKHILCEKPFALSIDECDQMINAASDNEVFLQEAIMYRYHPRALKLQEIMTEGILGDLQYIHAVLSFWLETAHAESGTSEVDIRLDPSLGGGSLWDIGYYAVNFARMIADAEPSEVRGWSRDRRTTGVDDTFFGTLVFPNEVIAHIECGFSQPKRFHGEIVGSKGMISLPYAYGFLWDGPEDPILRTVSGDSVISIEKANPYERQIAHLCDCVLENKQRVVPLEDARNNVAVVNALHKSAIQGESIPIE